MSQPIATDKQLLIDQHQQMLDKMKLGPHAPQAKGRNGLDKQDFMTLLVEEVRHQDPLNPKEGSEFLSSLVQFGMLDGINHLDSSMNNQLTESLQSNRALQATALVGRSVQIPAHTAYRGEQEPILGTIDIPPGADNVKIAVYSALDTTRPIETVSIGQKPPGEYPFAWDGKQSGAEGVYYPEGKYYFKALVESKEGPVQPIENMHLSANVQSVTVGQGPGDFWLNCQGLEPVHLSKVYKLQ